ncbi:hypothetical protein BJX65DRAFT_234580 [Aspergillus insuetus]
MHWQLIWFSPSTLYSSLPGLKMLMAVQLRRGPRSQGNTGSPTRRSQTTTIPSQIPSTRPPPISHPARWCWESSPSPSRPAPRHPSRVIKVSGVDDYDRSGNTSAQSGEPVEKLTTISQVLSQFFEIDSSGGRTHLPPDTAIRTEQPPRISFQLSASSANSSGRMPITTSTSVFRNPLEDLTTASNPNAVDPPQAAVLTTPRPSPPETGAEKPNNNPTTAASIKQSPSEKPAANTHCLIDAVEKVVQCARILDHDNESRSQREAGFHQETAALKRVTKNLKVSLKENEAKCEQLETELGHLAKEVRELQKNLETARGHQEILREFVVQMVTVLLAKTPNTGSG